MNTEMPRMESELLHLPLQVAPVERAAVASALMGDGGVEAAQSTPIGKAIGALGGLITAVGKIM
jgi:hypothetical protein